VIARVRSLNTKDRIDETSWITAHRETGSMSRTSRNRMTGGLPPNEQSSRDTRTVVRLNEAGAES